MKEQRKKKEEKKKERETRSNSDSNGSSGYDNNNNNIQTSCLILQVTRFIFNKSIKPTRALNLPLFILT